ncbi:IgaA/UmoB family intracellular growth attenuator, partial [Klebsiella pneumoniae]|uniref:IgaA/UmoB family intracellular growth attenuator n=1 Tax=Klebsiella pneumoniae TaxID=573 RepID=UPI003746F081
QSQINPQLAGHGGRVSLMEITDDGLAILQFGGGCNGCSMVDVLMHTPFHAEGIVTNLFTDANGTQHINLHRIPDRSGLWRYLG